MIDVYALATGALKTLDAETAHSLTLEALKLGLGPHVPPTDDPMLATELAGLKLSSPIGLAAGFDKNAEVARAMLAAGFGFVECGTVTPLPQAGNPRPRLFRLLQDQAVINRMGFNNQGLEAFAGRLARLRGGRPLRGPVGANIGANKDAADRMADYVAGLERLWPYADYFTVNISSPNTPGLRALQTRAALEELTGRLAVARTTLRAAGAHTALRAAGAHTALRAAGAHTALRAAGAADPPLFLKVAPDLASGEIDDIVEVVVGAGFDGIIVSNTTLARPDTLVSPHRGEAGGLSGAPLMAPSTEVLRQFHAAAAGRLVLIGAGGVASGADAYAKIRAGASAVQLYSAMAFKGPGLVHAIAQDLSARLKADGFASLKEAVGA